MEIIKMGKIPKRENTIRMFECGFCGTVFKAEYGEYIEEVTRVVTGDTNEFGFEIYKKVSHCPLCNREVRLED